MLSCMHTITHAIMHSCYTLCSKLSWALNKVKSTEIVYLGPKISLYKPRAMYEAPIVLRSAIDNALREGLATRPFIHQCRRGNRH